ncbi:hypothetical protein GCM10012275_58090 [Longimycelium tulufanense]|uniref:DNA primase/polymerase bifunctional N-terminal domain-containing protein n=1 Tax=Longimycelium tulufanense TaxID=907463 RepID=A0A8J3CDT6_9PSEU|nr:bifunctional DNA primase/polymerase [Longimycelium tulufanense]GGM79863.1 hypothetical protein GCM10012275_58090 [Longimycelium tulufanense]
MTLSSPTPRERVEALRDAALACAARGWPVFPIRPGAKKPPALHGDTTRRPCPRTGPCRSGHQGWEQRATTDPDRIRRCWATAPYNIGLAAGPAGLVVVDLDTPKSPEDVPPKGWSRRGVHDGHDVFALLCADAGQPVPSDTFTVRSARGGTHLYFQAPAGVRLGITEGEQGNGLGWKVDTRGWGGYVVAPGSITPDGVYRVTDARPPAELPGWLVQALTPKPPAATSARRQIAAERLPAYVRAAVRGECAHVRAAQATRHTRTLFVAACRLGELAAGGLLPPAQAETALLTAAGHMITGPCQCTEREVLRTIANGLRAGTARPRTAPITTPHRPAAPTGALFGTRGVV